MSKTIKDVSNPAFPSHGTMGEVNHTGMSLRDYYAGLAMQAILISHCFGELSFADRAKAAYEQSDALIKEGKQK